jgi:hypothetical protein
MKLQFLGTGTSTGIPQIGCKCSVCTSGDKKDSRLRSSVFITTDNCKILIDAGPDLLFFHRGLQALVAVELKKTKFHPRDLGQLEFYLEALDRDVKRSNENPSIGIILCPEADRVVVEYAMSRSMSPTMIAEYKRILIPQERMQQQLNEFCNLFLNKD